MMHPLVPQFILDKHVSGLKSGQLNAFVLFADVSGFSQISSTLAQHGQHGAEVLADLMRTVFDPLQDAVYAHRGFITASAGDAFTALIPADIPQAAERALLAALEIRDYVEEHNNQQTPYGNFPIGIKVGVAFGEVQWGIITSQDNNRATYYFRGSAIDAAAGAEKYADQGGVILAPAAIPYVESRVSGNLIEEHLHVVSSDFVVTSPKVNQDTHRRESQDVFFPKHVLELPSVGEFRESVSVFINLQGTPKIEVVESFMQNLFALQDQYGGVLNSLDFGDKGCKVLLFWGAPVSYENDVVRALNFLLDLQEVTPIPIKVGVTLRTGFAGFVGGRWHEEFTCYGHGVSLAARIMGKAPWENIWVDEPLAEMASPYFDIEFVQNLTLKGFQEPQAVFAIVDKKDIALDDFYQGHILGRKADLDIVKTFVSPLLDNPPIESHARFLVIAGEAGLGKSRLLHAFQEQLVEERGNEAPQFILCQTDEIIRSSLNPFRYWLKQYFGYDDKRKEAWNKRSFGSKFNQIKTNLSPDDNEQVEKAHSFLGALLDLYWPNSLYDTYTPEARYENTLRALETIFRVEANRRSLVLFLEDIHWLDDVSIEFLQRLAESEKNMRLAIVMTSRENPKELDKKLPIQTHTLKPLGIQAIRTLAEALLEEPVDDDFAHTLTIRSEGNPFIAEQLLLYLRERNQLEKKIAGWGLRQNATDNDGIPKNVRNVFTARLDRLSVDTRTVVQTASVLGREWDEKVLGKLIEERKALSEKITVAEQALIWSKARKHTYLFRHALMRDAAYDMQARKRLQKLHWQAGKALETIYHDDLQSIHQVLAHHFENAYLLGNTRALNKAVQYLSLAAETAETRFENDLALSYLLRALQLLPNDETERRWNLLLAQDRIFYLVGDYERQLNTLYDLGQLAGDNIERNAIVDIRLAENSMGSRDYDTGIKFAKQAYKNAQGINDLSLQARANAKWSEGLWRSGQLEAAKKQGQFGYQLGVSGNDKYAAITNLRISGIADVYLRNFNGALEIFELTRRLSQEIRDFRGEQASINNAAVVANYAGYSDKAWFHYHEALAVGRERFPAINVGVTLLNLCRTAVGIGYFDDAWKYIKEASALTEKIDDDVYRAAIQRDIARLHLYQGNPEKAYISAKRAIELIEETKDWDQGRYIYYPFGEALLVLGRINEAETAYQQALEAAEKSELPEALAMSHAGLALVAAERKDKEAICLHVSTILPLMKDASMTPETGSTSAQIYLACYRSLQSVGYSKVRSILHLGYLRVMADADLIEDIKVRTSYLTNIPYNAEIIRVTETEFEAGLPLRPENVELLVDDIRAYPNKEDLDVHQPTESTQTDMPISPHNEIAVVSEPASLPLPQKQPNAAALNNPSPTCVDLSGTILNHAILDGCNLEGVLLRAVSLDHASLRHAILNNVVLEGGSLRSCDLRASNLTAVNLKDADLQKADLRGAILHSADFTGANLCGADLRGATIFETSFVNVKYDDTTQWGNNIKPT